MISCGQPENILTVAVDNCDISLFWFCVAVMMYLLLLMFIVIVMIEE